MGIRLVSILEIAQRNCTRLFNSGGHDSSAIEMALVELSDPRNGASEGFR